VSVQRIRLLGDPVLRTPAEPVTTFDKELRVLVKDLWDTMLDAPGAGLAAPQIGVGLRVFTYDVGESAGHLVNPTIVSVSEETDLDAEGCLSLPGLSYDLARHASVVAHGYNEFGDPVVLEGSEILARCIQHEVDHLDGVIFIDRLDDETRRLAMREIREADWGQDAVVKASPHPMYGTAL
jgi:peptide deformylase